jgi:hypothetical protein
MVSGEVSRTGFFVLAFTLPAFPPAAKPQLALFGAKGVNFATPDANAFYYLAKNKPLVRRLTQKPG